MTLPPDTSSNEVLRLVAQLRQIDQLLYKISQSRDWETMRPHIRELCEGMYDRMRAESDRIRMVMISQIREACVNAAPQAPQADETKPQSPHAATPVVGGEDEIARIIDPWAFTEHGTAARCAEARQKAKQILDTAQPASILQERLEQIIKSFDAQRQKYRENADNPKFNELQQEIWASLSNEKADDLRVLNNLLSAASPLEQAATPNKDPKE